MNMLSVLILSIAVLAMSASNIAEAQNCKFAVKICARGKFPSAITWIYNGNDTVRLAPWRMSFLGYEEIMLAGCSYEKCDIVAKVYRDMNNPSEETFWLHDFCYDITLQRVGSPPNDYEFQSGHRACQ